MAKQVAPEFVVGRDRLIKRMWRTLERASVRFTAERRIGKTTVMKKMQAEPPEGTIVLYADLEKVDTPVRFVETLLADLHKYLTRRRKTADWIGKFIESIGGSHVGGLIKIPQKEKREWQSALEKTLANACTNQSDQRLIFLWDEIPYMLQKIHALERARGSNDNSALAILDSLRAVRDLHSNLRMIFTGSVGLHHVLAELRGDQFASQPVNDMPVLDIGPLSSGDAATLTRELLASEEIECSDLDAVVDRLSTLTDCVPFYIHRVVSRLATREQTIDPDKVESEIKHCLTDPNDPWEMAHFRERLPIYYPGTIDDAERSPVNRAVVAKRLLNHLALSSKPQTIDQCYRDLKSQEKIEDRDAVVRLLDSLAKDHYLTRDDDGCYAFRFPLLQRWWVLAEGLQR